MGRLFGVIERKRKPAAFSGENGRADPPWLFVFIFLLLCFNCTVQPIGIMFVRARSQEGFISVDCGYEGGSSYKENSTGVYYVGDSRFISSGENKIVPNNPYAQRYGTLRSFPNGTRNCYRLFPVKAGTKYIVRAGFFYGNYDGLRVLPSFDLHIGVDFWATIQLISDVKSYYEIITTAQRDNILICLVHTGKSTPFISLLELRPVLDSMYPIVNASLSLFKQRRTNYGAAKQLRYPNDAYDRIWKDFTRGYALLNTTREVKTAAGDAFQVPVKVLETAISAVETKSSRNIHVSGDPGERVYAVLHFAELLSLNYANESRKMDIYVGDSQVPLVSSYSPPSFRADHIEIDNTAVDRWGNFNITIKASSSSTIPFIINAAELFFLRPMKESPTNDGDVSAMEDIKRTFKLTRNWEADPCSPRDYIWKGVICSYEDAEPARIISLNLSSSGLSGEIPSSIGNLTALQILDLSNNNLTGAIPVTLGDISSLQYVNLSGNKRIAAAIPQSFCKKLSKNSFSFSFNGESNQCENSKKDDQRKVIVPVILAASVIIILMFIVLIWIVKRKTGALSTGGTREVNKTGRPAYEENHLQKKCVKYTYKEIIEITHNLRYEIGKGGFGTVYLGHLENGSKVAVKVLSLLSSQGYKEFLAEVQILARAHHKNVVCLLGYCDEEENLSLVYEYMENGTLREHLSGDHQESNILDWDLRVNIALQSATGLEYLHIGCTPPIVHRDIKSSNILLDIELVAKISDFGLSKAINSNNSTYISTTMFGTPGYLAPEYYETFRLNEKSDVYSFGVVLLEIITGQPPHQKSTERTHIVGWVQSKIENGDIMNIIDPRLQGEFDINMAWKIVEVAMSCTSENLEERMTMSEIIIHLKQCLYMNESHTMGEDIMSSTKELSRGFASLSSSFAGPARR